MSEWVAGRAEELYQEHRRQVFRRTDRLFGVLILGQWIFGILVALVFSPYGWHGKTHVIHAHVWIALGLGGAVSSLPLYLSWRHAGEEMTRYVMAIGQVLWSALLIHLSGGRIETHFHVFGSLAFIAFYRDWRVLVPATVVVAADHLVRQNLWPESVYGIVNPEWWRFIEHAFWVVFEDTILVFSCIVAAREMRDVAFARATTEETSRELEATLGELRKTQEQKVRSEKLAAVGQLAASVGHELRNPLAAVRNAATFLTKRLKDLPDPKVPQFLGIVDRELAACTKIIGDLLDFARERAPVLAPCPLRPLVEEAMAIVPEAPHVALANEVPGDLAVPYLDKDQARQIVVNLVQNAVEAMPPERKDGRVTVKATGGGATPFLVTIADNGAGMPDDVRERIFEPLFTTKTKGTGLGLAIVADAVRRHGGKLTVASKIGEGTTFTIELPGAAPANKERVA